jgi:beta-D-xylosidase 4
MRSSSSISAGIGLAVLSLITSVVGASNSTCPPAINYTATFEYVGCRQDSYYGRILGRERKAVFRDTNTPQYCADYCGRSGYPWAGVEAGT